MKPWPICFLCLAFYMAGASAAAQDGGDKLKPAPSADKSVQPEANPADRGEVEKKAQKEVKAPPVAIGPGGVIPEMTAAKPKPKALSPEDSLQAQWRFLNEAGQDPDKEAQDAVIDELRAFVDGRLDAPMRSDALYLLATLRQKRGDPKAGFVDLLRLLYEYPDSKLAMKAKSDFLDGAERKFSRRLKPAEAELIKVPQSEDKAERLAALDEKLAVSMEDSLYDASVAEMQRFSARFPDYPALDKVQWSLAQLHDKAGKSTSALLAYRKLLALYPESPLRPKAQFAVGALYADSVKDYKKAIDAFSELVEKYPGSPDILAALQRNSKLFSEKLKQYQLAVEVDEKIIRLFPKSDGALAAFQDEAKLQRDRLEQSAEAIKTQQRLAQMFPAAAIEALREAARIARKDLKDYKQEVEIRHGIAKNFSTAKEAAEELFSAAEVCEDDLKDQQQALSLYKEVGSSFPGTKQAKKAADRIAKLDQAAQQK